MNILWIDDEIELLKPHCIFLENKGYKVSTLNNAIDAFDVIENQSFSAVLLDENMPGVGGIDALKKIKEIRPNLPVVMITKNEEEEIMEEAIGRQIADYILKPVNPKQILLSLKKILSSDKIIEEKTVTDYMQEFRAISTDLMNLRDENDWFSINKKLIYWDIRLEKSKEESMNSLLEDQKSEANSLFFKYIENEYKDWLKSEDAPVLSHTVFRKWVAPEISKEKTLLLVVDNLRFDQWTTIEPLFKNQFNSIEERSYFSILPSATQYARNAFFSGMTPLEMEKKFPEYWLNDTDEGNKNQYEKEYLSEQLKRLGLGHKKSKYIKILNVDFERKIYEDYNQLKKNDFITIVYNFIDILSHSKTDNKIVSEMIRDDQTFRSLTKNWFENSYILKLINQAKEDGFKVIITTDHGMIYIKNPIKVVGDKETSTNLRYKLGRSLAYDKKNVLEANKPEEFMLPKVNITSKYIFAKENYFFAYPNNYHQFVNYYKDTYQHGGVSMQEMIIPFVILQNK
ncbi:MAG: PglZ domain-containing protein [Flavobacteriales bacterium]|nr:PglZ domain-containing protein [Flavobacteriales bacterium]